MNGHNGHGELEVSGPMGLKARARGYRVMDIICIAALCASIYTAFAIAQHKEDAAVNAAALAKVVDVRQVELIRLNQELVDAQKRQLEEQRRHSEAVRALICINVLPIDKRESSEERCWRIAKEAR